MYAIRSYYDGNKVSCYKITDEQKELNNVITSYSIHYTKLYELPSWQGAGGAILHDGAVRPDRA